MLFKGKAYFNEFAGFSSGLFAKKTENGDQLIGSISSVTERSVSLHVDTKSHAKNKIDPWLAQTRYGYEFWALTKKYRSTFYTKPIPDPRLRIFP
nr:MULTISPECIES: DUF4054 domain-containing protein [unclassified Commensalibacter]